MITENKAITLREPQALKPFEAVKQSVEELNKFYKKLMQLGTDYDTIPGTQKPTLLKPGAELLRLRFGFNPHFKIDKGLTDVNRGFIEYDIICSLYREGEIIAEGVGNANSLESKWRYRWVWPDELPKDFDKAKAFETYGATRKTKKGGIQYRIENENPQDQVNTILKIAKKRCLGSTTPVIVKTDRNVLRTNASHLYSLFLITRKPMYLPSPNGSWRQIKGMNREQNREVYRIDLADGSYIRATGEHRFPTKRGLLCVKDIIEGDVLLRSALPDTRNGHRLNANNDIAWSVGLFLAEGHFRTSKAVQFTLSKDEMGFANRVTAIAEQLGSHAFTTPRNGDNKVMDTTVYGEAFTGLMRQFISGESSKQKHLSLYAWSQGREFLSNVLDGYLNGDGHLLKKRTCGDHYIIGFTGRNHELAHDLRAIGTLCNRRVLIKSATSKCNDKVFPTYSGWVKPNIISYNQKVLEQVVAIKKEAKLAVVYDIEVDGDHIFCLSNGIQTHNSFVDAILTATGASRIFTQDIEEMSEDAIETPSEATEEPTEGIKPSPVTNPLVAAAKEAGGIELPNMIKTYPKLIKQYPNLSLENCWEHGDPWVDGEYGKHHMMPRGSCYLRNKIRDITMVLVPKYLGFNSNEEPKARKDGKMVRYLTNDFKSWLKKDKRIDDWNKTDVLKQLEILESIITE